LFHEVIAWASRGKIKSISKTARITSRANTVNLTTKGTFFLNGNLIFLKTQGFVIS
jgi:hypothetical protein